MQINPNSIQPQSSCPERPDVLSREAVLADLEQFQAALPIAAVYNPQARSAALLEVQRLQTQAGSLSRAGLLAALARLAATAHDGHTKLDFSHLGQALPQLPVRLKWFADGLYVTAVAPPLERWLGSQVIRLEEHSADDWLALLSDVIGGTPPHVRHESPHFLITPALLQALGWSASGNHLRLLLRNPGGELLPVEFEVSEEIPTITVSPKPGVLKVVGGDISVLIQELPGHALYIGLRQITSGSDGPLPHVLEQALDTIRNTQPERLIVDLRGNGGGNYILARPFTLKLRAAAGQARLYALIDEGTFSAAIVTLAWLRHDAEARIVGSGPGDAERFYAEPLTLNLAGAGLRLFLATQAHDWAQGCHDLKTCFWLNLLYGVPAGSLRPEWCVQSTFRQFMQGEDATLRAALLDDTVFPVRFESLPPEAPLSGTLSHQVAYCGMLLASLGERHGREEWGQMGALLMQQAQLTESELSALRDQHEEIWPNKSDAEVLDELRGCGTVLTPLLVAYSLQRQ